MDIVLECTGLFTSRDSRRPPAGRRRQGADPAPGKDVDATVVYGVNHEVLRASHRIVSNASCTTNCLAPVAQVLHRELGIEHGLMTTIHAYTNDQNLSDVYHPDLYRARSATWSMIPTKTGAAEAVGQVLPELAGKLTGLAAQADQRAALVDPPRRWPGIPATRSTACCAKPARAWCSVTTPSRWCRWTSTTTRACRSRRQPHQGQRPAGQGDGLVRQQRVGLPTACWTAPWCWPPPATDAPQRELAPTARLQRQQAQVGLGEDQSLLGLVRALPGTDFLARTPAAAAHVGIELTDIDARTFQAFPFSARTATGPRPSLHDRRWAGVQEE